MKIKNRKENVATALILIGVANVGYKAIPHMNQPDTDLGLYALYLVIAALVLVFSYFLWFILVCDKKYGIELHKPLVGSSIICALGAVTIWVYFVFEIILIKISMMFIQFVQIIESII